MKLKHAPMICHRYNATSPWLIAAANRCRLDYVNTPGTEQDKFGLRKLSDDIWGINGPLGVHSDKTRKGFQVFGLVLVNDPGLVLFQGEGVCDLPVGAVYHIDGRADHAALSRNGMVSGLFGFMAWDVDRSENLAGLIADVPEAMDAYARGIARVDVSMDHLEAGA